MSETTELSMDAVRQMLEMSLEMHREDRLRIDALQGRVQRLEDSLATVAQKANYADAMVRPIGTSRVWGVTQEELDIIDGIQDCGLPRVYYNPKHGYTQKQ